MTRGTSDATNTAIDDKLLNNQLVFSIRTATDTTREYVITSTTSVMSIVDIVFLTVSLLLWSIFHRLTTSIPSWLLVITLLLWINGKRNTIREESLLVIRDFGVQVKTTYLGGRSTTRMIDMSRIKDVVINEGITMFQIKFYLAILVDKEDKMVVIFEHLLPSLKILLKVYRGTRSLIYAEEEEEEEAEEKHEVEEHEAEEEDNSHPIDKVNYTTISHGDVLYDNDMRITSTQ